ncbi:MAG: hypothetical protein BZY75_04075 [SAR202 cluster bacterium Io17-Chloro-G7]|nr:MAG: hypothetical protein BZY75_04075 [SAR202 cluster bacterium Io17-Chloro-G7]
MGVAEFLPDAPERDLYLLTAQLSPANPGQATPNISVEPNTFVEGRRDTFWLINLPELKSYQSEFELRHVTPHAYWYFEDGQSASQADIERAAAIFENQVYPNVTSSFGRERNPGIDNDPHINILNADLKGVGGYYSSADEYPIWVNKFSNQREIIYINSSANRVGTQLYTDTLAHELQHAIHWNADPSEDTWVNEGLSELAITIAGPDHQSRSRFSFSLPTSLVHWPLSQLNAGPNYGASSLFMHYLSEHYGDRNNLNGLLEQPEDGIVGINSYLNSLGYDLTFRDVFGNWAVANVLDEIQGVYGYGDMKVVFNPTKKMSEFSEIKSRIPQYSVEYIKFDGELMSHQGPLRLNFTGQAESALLPVEVGEEGCWWGNSGDSINATLSRSVDLTQYRQATLNFQVWFELEEDWDYAYLEVSTDGGSTWNLVSTPNMTSENPIGNSFGMGYTGNSDDWIEEHVDLTPYAGQVIQLRFQHITDDAVNGSGLCVRRISIWEGGPADPSVLNESFGHDVTHDERWQADGFILIANRVKQDYIVQVIESRDENRVTQFNLDQTNQGELIIPSLKGAERLVLAIASLAPKTRIDTSYTLSVEPAD